jgi:hypothetical protein
MKLATDLGDFLQKYGPQLAAAAEKRLNPLVVPGRDPMPDLSELEALRSSRQPGGKPFRFFEPQLERIAGAAAVLKNQRTAWFVMEMATGKTACSLATAWLTLKHKPDYRILVMAPGHLVRKWRREVEWLLPGVECRVIGNFADLKAFQDAAKKYIRPMVAEKTARSWEPNCIIRAQPAERCASCPPKNVRGRKRRLSPRPILKSPRVQPAVRCSR